MLETLVVRNELRKKLFRRMFEIVLLHRSKVGTFWGYVESTLVYPG